jgi:hypothetical protein
MHALSMVLLEMMAVIDLIEQMPFICGICRMVVLCVYILCPSYGLEVNISKLNLLDPKFLQLLKVLFSPKAVDLLGC